VSMRMSTIGTLSLSLPGLGLSPTAFSPLGAPLGSQPGSQLGSLSGSRGSGDGEQMGFASILARSSSRGVSAGAGDSGDSDSGGGGSGADTKAAAARKAAEEFVAMVFVDPILKKAREMNSAAPPFAPSTGEKQFGALLDAQIAQKITKAAHFPLVDRLARDLRRDGSSVGVGAEV